MFKILKGVSYAGGPPGQAFGGGIYNMSVSLGLGGEPTKVTLNIVNENGIYNEPLLDVTQGGAVEISVGDPTIGKGITFYRLYPYKWGMNQTANAKTLSVTLVDHAACFDKIFIGLTARHLPINDGNAFLSNESFEFTVRCLECNSLNPNFNNITGNVTRPLLEGKSPFGNYMPGLGLINGGWAVLGKEQWTDSNCEIPKVEYTFDDLLIVLSSMGFNGIDNLALYNRSAAYTAAYSGTLKEVLSAWASDFSFGFAIDPTSPSVDLVTTDLQIPVGLGAVKSVLASFNKGTGSLIRSKNESKTLEGSYIQTPIVKSIKPARTFSRQQTSYNQQTGNVITVMDAIGTSANYGRTSDQVDISIALAKYQPQARLIWLSDQAAKATEAGAAQNPFPSLGFIPLQNGQITDPNHMRQLAEMFYQTSGPAGGMFSHPIWQDTDNYSVFIGVWNPADQGYMESFDKELAGFLGKYGYWANGNPPPSSRDCPLFGFMGGDQHRYYDLASKISTLPDSKAYKLNSYPFQNILRASDGVFSSTVGGDPDGDYIFSLEDNAWGTNQEHVENALYNQWVYEEGDAKNWNQPGRSITDLEHYLPIYAKIDSNVWLEQELRRIIPNLPGEFLKDDQRTKGYFPGIALIPKVEKMMAADAITGEEKRVLEISYNSSPSYPNAKVYDNTKRRALEMVGDSAKDCTIYCEEDIVNDLCECPDIDDPLHKFSSYMSKYVTLKHVGNEVKLVFPVLNDYIGFWKAEQVYRGTYPKQIDILGYPPPPGANVMETRILDADVTNQLDPQHDGNGFQQTFIVRGAAQTSPITLAQYYNLLSTTSLGWTGDTEHINVKIDGVDYGGEGGSASLYPFLNPQSGLTGFNITVDGEGMVSDITFDSRPPKPPKRDVFIQKLNAVNAHQTMRMPSSNTSHGGVGLPFNP